MDMRRARASGSFLIAASVAGLLVVAGPVATSTAAPRHQPEVIQLSYSESSGDVGPNRRLEAFARHTDSLKFAVHYNGHRARVPGTYRSDITDTDIHGHGAKHPWVPDREHGGNRLIRLVHRSLDRRGFARVQVHAEGSQAEELAVVRIDLSRCTTDPPLYPVDCEVRV
jgi:hypothetical protein